MAQDITLQAYSAEEGGEHPVLWGSERVQDTLGWMRDDMLELADGANLIVVDREDIVELHDGWASTLTYDIPDKQITNPELLKNVNFDATVDNLRTIFNEAAPELDISRAELNGMAVGIIQDQAFAMPGEKYGLSDEYGLISTPDLTASKQELGGGMSMAGDDARFHNIPGEAEDYMAHTMFHESAHVGQMEYGINDFYQEMPLRYEIDADVNAFQAMHTNAGADGPIHPEAMATIYEARAAGGLVQGDWYQTMDGDASFGAMVPDMNFPSHMTHVGMDTDGQGFTLEDMQDMKANSDYSLPAPAADAVEEMDAALNVNTIVNGLAGSTLPMIKHQLEQDDNIDSDQYDLPETRIPGADVMENGSTLVQMHPEIGLAALESLIEHGKIEEGTPEMDYARDVVGFYHDHVTGLTEQPTYEAAKQSMDDLVEENTGAVPSSSEMRELLGSYKKPDHGAEREAPKAETPTPEF